MRLAVPLCLVAVLAAEARAPYGQKFPRSLRVLPAGGGQSSSSANLCDVFSSELTGSWFCMNGDGTTRSGSQAISAVGGPASQTKTLCPNGPNCASVTSRRTNGTSHHFKTGDVAPPTGDFSMVWVGTVDTLGAVQMFVAHDSDSPANNRGVALHVVAGGEVRIDLFKTDGASSGLQSTALVTQRATHTVVATYDFVTDGTSVAKLYLDGTEVATNSTFVGPIQAGSGTYWSIGERELSTGRGWLGGTTISAAMTEKVLSPTVVAAMADFSTGKLTGSYGEAITFARTSASTCQSEDGTELSVLPASRPCVSKAGLRIEPAVTNILLRSEELDNAAWANAGTPTVNANTWLSPDGSQTGETIVDNDVGVAEGRTQAVSTSSQVKFTFGCYFQFSALHPNAVISMTGTGNSAGNASCAISGTATTVRKSCSSSAAYGAGISAITVSVLFGEDDTATGNLKVWGCQLEAGSATESHATSYIRTAGGTVTRSAETNTFVNPLVTTDSSWCIAGTVNNTLTSNVNSRGIVALGSFAANNSALLRLEDTTKHPQAIIFDNAGGQKIITHSTVLGAGLTHLRFCSAGGTLTLYRDGASVGSVSGAGTGVITTMPGTVSVGINGTVSPFEDTVSDVCIGRGALSCAR